MTERGDGGRGNFGWAWVGMCVGMGLHTWDEAVHGFLEYYNATALAIYGHFWWAPRMDMSFRTWLTLLVTANAALFALTPLAFRNTQWLRRGAYVFCVIQVLNACVHTIETVRGSTVPSVVLEGPAPGVYTAPVLLAAAGYLWWSLRRSRAEE